MAIRKSETPSAPPAAIYQYPGRHRSGHLDAIALANAVTLVGLIGYGMCAVAASVSADLLVGFFGLWFHGISPDLLRSPGPVRDLAGVMLGMLTFGGSVWVATALTAWLYNHWTHSSLDHGHMEPVKRADDPFPIKPRPW